MVVVRAGRFRQGELSGPGMNPIAATPSRDVSVKALAIGRFEVSRAEFRQFVEAERHLTDAERNMQAPSAKKAMAQPVSYASRPRAALPYTGGCGTEHALMSLLFLSHSIRGGARPLALHNGLVLAAALALPAVAMAQISPASPAAEYADEREAQCQPLDTPDGWQRCAWLLTGTGITVIEHHISDVLGQTVLQLGVRGDTYFAGQHSAYTRDLRIEGTPLGRIAHVHSAVTGNPGDWEEPLPWGEAALCQPADQGPFLRCAIARDTDGSLHWLWWAPAVPVSADDPERWRDAPGRAHRLCVASTLPQPATLWEGRGGTWQPLTPDATADLAFPEHRCATLPAQPTAGGPQHLAAVWPAPEDRAVPADTPARTLLLSVPGASADGVDDQPVMPLPSTPVAADAQAMNDALLAAFRLYREAKRQKRRD
jgi:hypothetical protein